MGNLLCVSIKKIANTEVALAKFFSEIEEKKLNGL